MTRMIWTALVLFGLTLNPLRGLASGSQSGVEGKPSIEKTDKSGQGEKPPTGTTPGQKDSTQKSREDASKDKDTSSNKGSSSSETPKDAVDTSSKESATPQNTDEVDSGTQGGSASTNNSVDSFQMLGDTIKSLQSGIKDLLSEVTTPQGREIKTLSNFVRLLLVLMVFVLLCCAYLILRLFRLSRGHSSQGNSSGQDQSNVIGSVIPQLWRKLRK